MLLGVGIAQYAYFFPLWEEKEYVYATEECSKVERMCRNNGRRVPKDFCIWKSDSEWFSECWKLREMQKNIRHSPTFPGATEVIIWNLYKYVL